MKKRSYFSLQSMALVCIAWLCTQFSFGQSWPPVLPACEIADCDENPFCYFDFDDFEIYQGTQVPDVYFIQMGISNCQSLAENSPDITYFLNNPANKLLHIGSNDFGNFKESVYFPLRQVLPTGCSLQLEFDALDITGFPAPKLNFYGISGSPCNNAWMSLGTQPVAGVEHSFAEIDCASMLYPYPSPECHGKVKTIYPPITSLDLIHYSLTLSNNTSQAIDFLKIEAYINDVELGLYEGLRY